MGAPRKTFCFVTYVSIGFVVELIGQLLNLLSFINELLVAHGGLVDIYIYIHTYIYYIHGHSHFGSSVQWEL